MALIDKYESEIRKASLSMLKTGFVKLTDMEVELEAKLKELHEAKARLMVEIDIRINKKRDY